MKADSTSPVVSLRCAVLTISNRLQAPGSASATPNPCVSPPKGDTSGEYLRTALQEAGHALQARALCSSDRYQIRKIVSDWIADPAIQVILSTGGTGFARGKATIPAVTPLMDQLVPGFGELFRHLSWQDVGTSALQSEALCGIANDTLVFCLPGSTGACRLAWEKILQPQLDSRQRPCNFATVYGAA
ncbi:MAG: molybdenum cofactor biosynthesis protein [Candidimonas sp.]|nr:MAG: molybdenum cofactor biosynthesis protein [Candidimonas sp.]